MLGELFSVGSTLLNHALASSRQDDAQSFSAQQFATRYQTTVKDMEAAGLNPALAYQQGGGSPPSSTAASASGGDVGAMHLQSKLNSAQIANMEAQTAKTNEEANIIRQTGLEQARANINKTLTDTGLSASQVVNVETQTKKAIEEINNIPIERDRLKAAAYQLHKLGGLQEMQGLTEEKRKALLIQQANLVVSQTNLNNLDLNAAEKLGNIGREAGQLKPIIDILIGLLQASRPRGGGITINK